MPSVVIVLERRGEAGRQCEIVRELAGDFVLYERFFSPNQRIEPMTTSAVRLRFQSNAAAFAGAGFYRRLVLRWRIAAEFRRERQQIEPSPYSLYVSHVAASGSEKD
jgi:hypothetical protein